MIVVGNRYILRKTIRMAQIQPPIDMTKNPKGWKIAGTTGTFVCGSGCGRIASPTSGRLEVRPMALVAMRLQTERPY